MLVGGKARLRSACAKQHLAVFDMAIFAYPAVRLRKTRCRCYGSPTVESSISFNHDKNLSKLQSFLVFLTSPLFAGAVYADTTLVNVSCDPTREL